MNEICRAYKIVVTPSGGTKRALLEIAELPQRGHLLISFTNPDVPQGIGVPLERRLVRAVLNILQELEARMEGGSPDITRSITLTEGKRADEDSDIPF